MFYIVKNTLNSSKRLPLQVCKDTIQRSNYSTRSHNSIITYNYCSTRSGSSNMFSFLGLFNKNNKREITTTAANDVTTNKKRKLDEVNGESKKLKASDILLKEAADLKALREFKPDSVKKYDRLRPIIWIDCEMTGLDFKNDHIIEICCIITDKNLNIIDEEGYESVIHYPKEVMDSMNEWCIDHHGSSGLTEKVIKSEKTLKQVEEELYEYISKYVNKGVGILAGNSVHMDRLFMLHEMPKVIDYMTYRIIDVSSIMEVSRRHNPKLHSLLPSKVTAHTAKSDILESIAHLKFYYDFYLKNPNEIDTDAVVIKHGVKENNSRNNNKTVTEKSETK
ncbi:hypothetical protein B5S31_g4692 [[Candida] boidinii]|uniref:Unnamed protein product n=1 Tax=Candida boidinii TaxID=5477 RepID=A0ACB5TEV9_CANBO|nr:hypothetical protein B5S29_g4458 [[Candida] boidinii]OWB74861.1 hypothetical protein B5S31_g4692 [[Candida] boidinii]OWB79624.1 hypothetical protein B5S32_g3853 [[Candida] boidinii]GME87462.1 unnamed protein product [[Candida] boidinii]